MIESVKKTTLPVGNEKIKASAKDNKLHKVCAEFESLLIQNILKSGRNTLPGNGLFDKSNESEIYKSMMDERLAISVSEAKGFGLGDLLYKQLEKIQENSGSVKHLSGSM
jgi:peptidoglycan hydrolase FlgJ